MQMTAIQTQNIVRTFMARTYSWMTAGLALTAGIAFITAQNTELTLQLAQWRMILFFVQVGLVMFLSGMAHRMPSTVAGMLFLAYAAITGLTFSALLFVFPAQTVTAAFLTSALTFGAMSILGMTIKRDLSGLQRFVSFALIGFFVAVLVNAFLAGGTFTLILSVIGVLLFAGVTVYDTQMLRNMALGVGDGEMQERAAINGALALYLDFINIFVMLLNLFNSRD